MSRWAINANVYILVRTVATVALVMMMMVVVVMITVIVSTVHFNPLGISKVLDLVRKVTPQFQPVTCDIVSFKAKS